MLTISIQPPPVAAGITAKFESGGTTVQSPNLPAPAAPPTFGTAPPRPAQPPPAPPATVLWPGSLARTTVTVQPENGSPVSVGRDGVWSLFRALEAGSLAVRGQTATAQYLMGGQELHYQITTNSQINNPLDLATLRQFKCPTGI
jgi:type VI secretion system protein ImpL